MPEFSPHSGSIILSPEDAVDQLTFATNYFPELVPTATSFAINPTLAMTDLLTQLASDVTDSQVCAAYHALCAAEKLAIQLLSHTSTPLTK